MTISRDRYILVTGVYGLALLSIWLQFGVALSGPGDSVLTRAAFQARENTIWAVIAVLSVAIIWVTFFLFRDKPPKAGWLVLPGTALSLLFPAVFLAFRIRDFVDALHS